MRHSFIAFGFLLFAGLSIGGYAFLYRMDSKPPSAASGFALVELFTSEGCSSCPPADEILARIRKEYPSNVFVLGFHVDYWNSLGWKDIYSDPAYSRRQQEYGSLFGLNSIYTPQMVVNGRFQFVGSDEAQLRKILATELKNTAADRLQASATTGPDKGIQISYQARPGQDELLRVALI